MKGALYYNEKKVLEQKAELLTAYGFVKDAQMLSFKEKLNRFLLLQEKNERVKTNTVHISLNFSPKEKPDNVLLETIGAEYLQLIGFENQPFLLYRHYDAAHPHCHVLTTNIQKDGKRIDLHNIGRVKSEAARKAIERKYGLIKAEEQKKELKEIKKQSLEIANYGRAETKKMISSIVSSIVKEYNYTSLSELNAVLKQYGIQADRGNEGTVMFKNRGLRYSILDGKGEKIGVPIKASGLYNKPTLINLEKKFEQHKQARGLYKTALKKRIDEVFKKNTCSTMHDLEKALDQQQIRAVFRTNADGRIYGITFIDQIHKAVFNGSELGKSYSTKAVLERLADKKQKQVIESGQIKHHPMVEIRPIQKEHPTSQQIIPIVETLLETTYKDSITEFEKRIYKRRKKKLNI